MKASVTLAGPKFNPVNVTITLESAEELEVFRQLFWLTLSVPDIAYSHNTVKRERLKSLMNEVYESLMEEV